MRVVFLIAAASLLANSAAAQSDNCQTNITALGTAQTTQQKANGDAVALFLAFGVAIKMSSEKQKSYFSEYCKPEQLESFDKAAAALASATDAAKKVQDVCPEGRGRDGAAVLQKQYETMRGGAEKMHSAVVNMCQLEMQQR